MSIKLYCRVPLLALVGALIALPAWADPDRHHGHDHDHERARQALRRGEVMPIADILKRVAERVPGEVVEVEFERDGPIWIYELKILTEDGRLLEVKVDAARGHLLDVEED